MQDLYTYLKINFQYSIQETLERQYNLTSAEARVVLYSTFYQKVKEIAHVFDVSESTVRAQRVAALNKILEPGSTLHGKERVTAANEFNKVVINAIFELMHNKFINIDLFMGDM